MPRSPLPPLPPSLLRASHREDSTTGRAATLAAVVLAHLAAGWALMQVDTVRQAVTAAAPLMVSLLTEAPEVPPPPAPPPPAPVRPPPLQPPLLAARPRPLPTPEPVAFTAPDTPPAPPVAAAPAVAETPPAPPAPVTPAAPPAPSPKVIAASDIQCPTPARPDYPAVSAQLGETGTTEVRVLVDAGGRPQDVVLHKTSGHPRLDRAALAGARTLRCKPYTEAGVAQAVWVVAPIVFELD